MNNADVIIIGAGASGLFASIQLAWQGESVLVIEHMHILGKKLLITGKGRCNVTNDIGDDVQKFISNIPGVLKLSIASTLQQVLSSPSTVPCK